MNTQILYDLTRIYELMGLSHEAAFECAFNEYKALLAKGKSYFAELVGGEDELERLRRMV